MKFNITIKKGLLLIILFIIIIITIVIVDNKKENSTSFQEGYTYLYYGDNEIGNKKMRYAISQMREPNHEIYHALSVLNTKNGNYNVAIPALEKAYDLSPQEIGEYYGWVLLYYYHDYERALDVLNKYDNSTPNFSDWPMGECIHYLKGLSYMQLENYKSAIQEFDISIENTSSEHGDEWVNDEVFVNKGRCLAKLNKHEDAIQSFKRVIKHSDRCTEAYYFMGISQISLNQNAMACQNLKKAHILIKKGYKSSDTYVELFHEIYEQQVNESVLNNCLN